ncbi:glycosyltransferase family 2 protein [Pseudooceanicola aestuarii]|uniref:glycosyltransferase family 2 protein n=1 Tax=Pseudooceanicola aestuarii TaxID=2697319 RepID=UPI0013D642B4|nr:glycosyltransferase family 2 protein [Pseudooceanicola aestuarii]
MLHHPLSPLGADAAAAPRAPEHGRVADGADGRAGSANHPRAMIGDPRPLSAAVLERLPAAPVVIAIASTGRAPVLRRTLDHLAARPNLPDLVLTAVASAADLAGIPTEGWPFPLDLRITAKGSCSQRNALLDVAPEDALLLFLDDDFLIGDTYIPALRRLFARHSDIALVTGHVVADGILGPGFDHDTGARLLANADPVLDPLSEVYNGYGCNMALRAITARRAGIRFDEALPRYGWLEDVDFSRRLAGHGRIMRNPEMRGVHLGTKSGRSRGDLLGYSQVANPIYLLRKGTLTRRRALRMLLRNCMGNLLHLPLRDPLVDRRGRVAGNSMALRDLLRGRLSPDRILTL